MRILKRNTYVRVKKNTRRGRITVNYNKSLEDSGEFAIDVERIYNAHSKLWTIVTEPTKNGEEPSVKILDKKTIAEGITAGTVATMSIPHFTGAIPKIDGVKYL